MGLVQEYEWGTIDWLTDQNRLTSEAIDVGITTIFPGLAQEKHIHYGDEQWLYVISGSGISVVDQIECELREGVSINIPAGAIHETTNLGESSLVQILISYPKQIDDLWSQNNNNLKSSNHLIDVSNKELVLSDDVKNIIEAYSETLNLPISIYNTNGGLLSSWEKFPKACCELCNVQEKVGNCHIYEKDNYYSSPAYSEQSAYYCRYGLAVIDTPIIFDNQMIGIIRGGHVLIEDDANQIHPVLKEHTKNLAIIPKGRLRIVLAQYKKLAVKLAENYNTQMVHEIEGEHIITDESTQRIRTLKCDLDLALGKILNIQINNHFLFNTLNAIAGLALEEDAFETYRSIIDLSKLFRYNLRNTQEFVSIKDEIEYIKNYSDLQKIRFGDRLTIDFEIENEALKYYIPFNTLQPIVENSFVHGFRNAKNEMNLCINVKSESEYVKVSVKDNGQGLDEKKKKVIYKRIGDKSIQRRGLSMTIDRLELFFGNEVSFNITSEIQEGFCMDLKIPKRTIRGGGTK